MSRDQLFGLRKNPLPARKAVFSSGFPLRVDPKSRADARAISDALRPARRGLDIATRLTMSRHPRQLGSGECVAVVGARRMIVALRPPVSASVSIMNVAANNSA